MPFSHRRSIKTLYSLFLPSYCYRSPFMSAVPSVDHLESVWERGSLGSTSGGEMRTTDRQRRPERCMRQVFFTLK